MKTIRSHMKRRLRSHLENPPSYCGCHQSKIIDNTRLKLIEFLKEDDDAQRRSKPIGEDS